MFSVDIMHLVSVMSEAFLVGAYAVLVGLIIWTLKNGHKTMPLARKILFVLSITMFLISVAHLGLLMQQVTEPIVPKANFQTRVVLSVIQYIIGDLIVIWRVWVVWGRRHWIVVGPLVMLAVSAGLSLNLINFTERRSFFTISPVVLIVANTTLFTLLIAGRIWFMKYRLRRLNASTVRSSTYSGAILLVIETGALYALVQLISLILARTKNPGLPIVMNMEIPLIGILPTLIIVLVYFQRLPGSQMAADYGQRLHRRSEPPPPSRIILRDDFSTRTKTTTASRDSGDAESKGEISHHKEGKDGEPQEEKIEDIRIEDPRDVSDIV